ncbi:Transgelin [Arthrobotrys entomopaga]|nr:Transgelin [Arthrobotrys entomopaga]
MASVSSLDKDLAQVRLGKYTVQAEQETKAWIESVLNESLGNDDLMEALHDGTVLCRLVNKLTPGTAKFKQSEMPFVQRENIAMFLRVCQHVLKLPEHDLFLTVDLYDYKDPAQVIQTIGAFSRIAHARNPSAFPTAIGPKASTPAGKPKPPVPTKQAAVSSWSKTSDELTTAPAWNIHQYGYMGGASQGTQGVVMGARRQITTAPPQVPSLREKEEQRKQHEEEVDARRVLADTLAQEEERERQRREESLWLRKEEEQRRRKAEEEQAARTRYELELQEKDAAEAEKIRLREEAHALREAEDQKRRDYEKKLQADRANQDRLEYQESNRFRASNQEHMAASESDRIKELERQLEEARAREREYLSKQQPSQKSTPRTITPPSDQGTKPSSDAEEREFLKKSWMENQSRPVPPKPAAATKPPAYTHNARAAQRQREMQDEDDAEDVSQGKRSASPAPPPTPPRNTSQAPTTSPFASTRWGFKGGVSPARPPPSGSMSIVQREMELERQRQKEWERNQEQLAEDRKVMTDKELKDGSEMPWDVNQYGYLGGANQGTEQVSFGARRQIIGPKGGK